MGTTVRGLRVVWSLLVLVGTIVPWLTVDPSLAGLLDVSADELLPHVMFRTMGVAPRAEDVCDVVQLWA